VARTVFQDQLFGILAHFVQHNPRRLRFRKFRAAQGERDEGDTDQDDLLQAAKHAEGLLQDGAQTISGRTYDRARARADFSRVQFQATGCMGVGCVIIIASRPPVVAEAREYLMLSAMAGYVASGDKANALALWESHGQGTRAQRPAFRLLRCHADPKSCAAAFRTYAERY
jgi:hypothetical protein